MNRPFAIAVAVVILAVVVACAIVFSNPLRRSELHLRDALLAETPIGSGFDEVRSLLNARGMLVSGHHEHLGFIKQPPGQPAETIGIRSLRAHLGYYQVLFRTDVTAFYGFDSEDKLIEIWVRKETDSL